jgi:hypothetical protein
VYEFKLTLIWHLSIRTQIPILQHKLLDLNSVLKSRFAEEKLQIFTAKMFNQILTLIPSVVVLVPAPQFFAAKCNYCKNQSSSIRTTKFRFSCDSKYCWLEDYVDYITWEQHIVKKITLNLKRERHG